MRKEILAKSKFYLLHAICSHCHDHTGILSYGNAEQIRQMRQCANFIKIVYIILCQVQGFERDGQIFVTLSQMGQPIALQMEFTQGSKVGYIRYAANTIVRQIQALQIHIRIEVLDGLNVVALQVEQAQMNAFLQALNREYAIEGEIQLA